MSWWDTGENDDVIGDRPADLARQALRQIADARAGRGLAKPSMVDLLRAIGGVATGRGRADLEGMAEAPLQIVAELTTGERVPSGPLRESPAAEDLIGPLADALAATRDAYRERWGRGPRLSEWLETFVFILRVLPEDFLSDGQGRPPARMRAEAP